MSLLQGRIWVLRNSPLGTQQRSPGPWSSNALDFRRPHMEGRVVWRGDSCHPGMVEDACKLFSLFYFSSASFETWVKSQRVARLNKEKDLFSLSLRSSLVVFTLHSWSQCYPLLWGAADAQEQGCSPKAQIALKFTTGTGSCRFLLQDLCLFRLRGFCELQRLEQLMASLEHWPFGSKTQEGIPKCFYPEEKEAMQLAGWEVPKGTRTEHICLWGSTWGPAPHLWG